MLCCRYLSLSHFLLLSSSGCLAQCAASELVLIKRAPSESTELMGDKSCPEDPLHCSHACCRWTALCAKIWGNGQNESNHRGILPRGQLGCTRDLVTNCPFFPIWSELSFLFTHTISGPPTPHSAFRVPTLRQRESHSVPCHPVNV